MQRFLLLLISLLSLLSLAGCYENNSTDTTTTSVTLITNERYPSFVVQTVKASKGDKSVVVHVSLKDNPGFLTMAMDIDYDSDNMILTEVLNTSDYSEYNFVGPKNKQSGCTASWFTPEMPDKIIDGNILELRFDIKEKAKAGSYPIVVSRPDNGGIVDQNKEEIIFNNAIGYIKIN